MLSNGGLFHFPWRDSGLTNQDLAALFVVQSTQCKLLQELQISQAKLLMNNLASFECMKRIYCSVQKDAVQKCNDPVSS